MQTVEEAKVAEVAQEIINSTEEPTAVAEEQVEKEIEVVEKPESEEQKDGVVHTIKAQPQDENAVPQEKRKSILSLFKRNKSKEEEEAVPEENAEGPIMQEPEEKVNEAPKKTGLFSFFSKGDSAATEDVANAENAENPSEAKADESEVAPAVIDDTSAAGMLRMQNKIVKEGFLWKQGFYFPNRLKKRWFVITDDGFLLYYKNPKSATETTRLKLSQVSGLTPLDLKRKKHPFVLKMKGRVKEILLATDSSMDRDNWLAAINTIIGMHPPEPVMGAMNTAMNSEMPSSDVNNAEVAPQ